MRKRRLSMVALSLSFSLLLSGSLTPVFADTDEAITANKALVNDQDLISISDTLANSPNVESVLFGEEDESGIVIPDDAGNAITLPTVDGDLSLSIPVKQGAEYEALGNGDVVVKGDDEYTNLIIQDFTPVELQEQMDGLRIVAILDSPEADPLLEFDFDLPQTAQGTLHEDGTVEISNQDGDLLGAIGPAWAVDAEGKSVPTWYEYEQGHVYQYVDHLSGDYAYPIAADPAFLVPLLATGGRILFQRVVAPALAQAAKAAVRQLARRGVKATVTGYRLFTYANYRHNIKIATSRDPGRRCDAHHTLPVKFEDKYKRAGFTGSDTIHHPKYLVWWEIHDHRAKAHKVNQSWQKWFDKNPRPTKKSVLNKRSAVLREYPPRC